MKPYSHDILESDLIRSDIETTRQSMDHTIDELSERMKPRHLLDEALAWIRSEPHADQVKDRARELAHAAGRACERSAVAVKRVVQEHPFACLLVGAGVAWAVYESAHRSDGKQHSGNGGHFDASDKDTDNAWSGDTGFGEKAAEEVESTKQGLHKVAHQVKEKVSAAGHQLQETGHKLGQQAARKARDIGENIAEGAKHNYEIARTKFVETSQSHPFSVGLGFLAAGVLVGLALPSTEQEDALVGETADRIKEDAKTKGRELADKGRNVATAAVEAAKKSATEQGLTPEPTKTAPPSGQPGSNPPPSAGTNQPPQNQPLNPPQGTC